MGLVFRARRRRDGEPVAVKVIALDGLGPGGRRELAESVRREAHVGRTLQHPGIVRVMASGEDRWDGRDVAFIVMEYVDGAPLADALRRIRDAHEAVRVARDLAEALAHAHAREVVHGDVKPGNVKLAPDGRVMLLDFGIARTTTGGQPGAGNGQRVVLVTPGWASPEQVADRVELDGRTDLFSLGLVLYCLLTGLGESPFARPSVPSTLDAVRSLELPPPSTLSPLMQRLDAARRDALDVLVATLLAKDRDRRFRTADDLVETLDQWLEWGEDAPAPLGLVALLERGPAAAHAANALERLVGEVVALVADPRAQNALRFALREFQPQLLAGRDPADVGADVKRLVRLTTIREHERGPLAAAIQAALGSGRPAPPLAEPRRPLVRGRGPDAAVAAAEA
jgi:serine/threonine-protein kinase